MLPYIFVLALMFTHTSELSMYLQESQVPNDLIFQILIDSRFVSESAVKTYCELLRKSSVWERSDLVTISSNRWTSSSDYRLSPRLIKPLIIVLTRNSSSWISHQATFFLKNDMDILYYVDSRSNDNTFSLLCDSGAKTLLHCSVGETLETGMQRIISEQPDRWILRLDDDEIISPRTYRHLVYLINQGSLDPLRLYSLSRKWLFRPENSSVSYVSRYQIFLDNDYQTRIFFSANVCHNANLHTPGFSSSLFSNPIHLPKEDYILHFDSILHSLNQRLIKLVHYDRIDSGNFTRYKSFYVTENIPFRFHCGIPFSRFEVEPEIYSYGECIGVR